MISTKQMFSHGISLNTIKARVTTDGQDSTKEIKPFSTTSNG